VLKKGEVIVGISHNIATVSAAALSPDATETTVAGGVAFTMTWLGEHHLWYTEGQIEYFSHPDWKAQEWVFDGGGRTVTAALAAPAAQFDAAVADFLPILNTFTVPG
jgi:hypothetical protein